MSDFNPPHPSKLKSGITAKRIGFLTLGLLVFAIDQLSKHPFRTSWYVGETMPVYPWLSFTYVQNTGSLAGMFQGNPVPLGIISMLVSIGIVWYAWRLPRNSGWLPYLTLGTLIGGALGNGYDRLVYRFVVDFFDLQWQGKNIWPVFNVADIAVDVAIGLFILMAILDHRQESKASKAQAAQAQDIPESQS